MKELGEKFLRVVSEDGVDVYSTHASVIIKEERVSLFRLSKNSIRVCVEKRCISEKKRGETSHSLVWLYKIGLSHDDKNKIEQHARTDSRTKRPTFGWIRERVPNKTDAGFAGKVRLERISQVNGLTDKYNENMEGKAPKVALDKSVLATLRQIKPGAQPLELHVMEQTAVKTKRAQKRQCLESMDSDNTGSRQPAK